jgi:hypothetical protein
MTNKMTKVHYGGTVRTIAYRQDFVKHENWYVAQVPGEGGVDWGYTTDIAKARGLNKYWQRRFAADARHVGHKAYFWSTAQ